MSKEARERRDVLKAAAEELAADRYVEAAGEAEREEQAAAAADCAYLLAQARYLRAERDLARTDVPWLAHQLHQHPRESLRCIRAICEETPDLHAAVQMILALHHGVSRTILASAVKRFRRDVDALSVEDVTGLLTAAWNGGQQGFEAVLRTRKTADRKAMGAPSWLPDDRK
jgi:hypothetical protein